MSSETTRLTAKGLIGKILEPHPNVKDTSSRQRARVTTVVAFVLAATSLVMGIISLIARFPTSLIIGSFILAVTMSIACFFGRTENYEVGSTFLVGGLILGGFFIGTTFSEITAILVILLAAIVPALTLSIILLPLLAIIIIAVVVLITIGVLPLMANVSSGTELLLFFGLGLVESVFVLIAWLRERTETLQEDEIGNLRSRLEERVEERTRYARIAADIAQEIMAARSLEELLNQATSLTGARFSFTNVGIFLVDRTGHHVDLKSAHGTEIERQLRAGKRIKFGPPSLLGWVAENKQQRLATSIAEDPMHLEPEFLAGSQSELGIPILRGDNLLGVMDVQSNRSTVFDNETIVVLLMLASQIATAIYNVRLLEAEQGGIQEVIDTYQTGFKVDRANTEKEVYQAVQDLFSKSSSPIILLTPGEKGLIITAKSAIRMPEGQSLPESISLTINDLEPFLTTGIFIGERNRLNNLPYNLVSVLRQIEIFSAALIPIRRNGSGFGVLVIGTYEKNPLEQASIQHFVNLAGQIGPALDRIQKDQGIADSLTDKETVSIVSAGISQAQTEKDILGSVQKIFGDIPTASVLLQARNDMMWIAARNNLTEGAAELPDHFEVSPVDLLRQVGKEITIIDVEHEISLYYVQTHPELNSFLANEGVKMPVLPRSIFSIIDHAKFTAISLVPIVRNGELDSLIIIGTMGNQPLTPKVKSTSVISDLIITALDRIHLLDQTRTNITLLKSEVEETTRSHGIQLKTATDIIKARTDEGIFTALQQLFQGVPNAAILLVAEQNSMRIAKSVNLFSDGRMIELPEWINVTPDELKAQLGDKVLMEETH